MPWDASEQGIKQQVHALLGEHGIRLEHADTFGVKGWRSSRGSSFPAFSRQRLDSCLRLITVLDGEIEHADFELLTAFDGDDRVARLRAIPGIGFLTAVTVLAEVGDISPLRLGSAAVLLGRADTTGALQRPAHQARPHLQAGLPVAALDPRRGRGDEQGVQGRRPARLPAAHRQAPRQDDRARRRGAPVVDALLTTR